MTRLNKILDNYIHVDQTGFIKGRQLSDCTRKLMIDYLQSTNIPALKYFSDTEKAFDRVHWSFLKAVLWKMGFREYFMQCITLIYTSQGKEIWIERCKSRKLYIGRGVRQGCPLMPLLFNIMIETLALAM